MTMIAVVGADTFHGGMGNVIDIRGLVKKFGSFTALDRLDLEVAEGEIHGFLGPNGAGKSTAIRVLLGLLKADGGKLSVLGKDPWKEATALHHRLAYVPGDVALWPTMSGGEAIDLLGNLRGGLNSTRRTELLDRFELDPTKRGRQYSKGNRQKVALVAALSSDVELLILDEPTSGLDPLMENVFQETVREAADRGATVLLSSHIMSEVEQLTDRLTIIRDGRTVASGSLADLRGTVRSTVTASVRDLPEGGEDGLRDALSAFDDVQLTGTTVTGHAEQERISEAVTQVTALGLESIQVDPPSLEELFLHLYEDDAREDDVVEPT